MTGNSTTKITNAPAGSRRPPCAVARNIRATIQANTILTPDASTLGSSRLPFPPSPW